ncbi:MAG: hypothetical protein V3U16_00730 [Candidatus Neomarinimicrobiota bacterium]
MGNVKQKKAPSPAVGCHRFGEKVVFIISPILSLFFSGPLRKYQPIRAESVAAAMVANAANNPGAVSIYESDQLKKIER